MSKKNKKKKLLSPNFLSFILFKPKNNISTKQLATKQFINEQDDSSTKKRTKYTYESNQAPSLQLDADITLLQEIKDNDEALLKISEKNIIHHANMRVNLFFYTLIAYYNTRLFPSFKKTSFQYGRARMLDEKKIILQACHSSFFGEFGNQITEKDLKYPIDFLSNTHFLKSLNSTVELPYFVNRFDDLLEDTLKCRKKLLSIILDVAQAKYSVIEGMRAFFIVMEKAFAEINNDFSNFHTRKIYKRFSKLPSEVRNKLFTLIKSGTFKDKWDDEEKTLNPEYIELILRITPSEKKNLKNKHLRENLFQKKIADLNFEITNINTHSRNPK